MVVVSGMSKSVFETLRSTFNQTTMRSKGFDRIRRPAVANKTERRRIEERVDG
jgi:hypothetical protein